jgi:hypothetical protein
MAIPVFTIPIPTLLKRSGVDSVSALHESSYQIWTIRRAKGSDGMERALMHLGME